MELDVNTPALLFPAISLLMLAYTNRFFGLAGVVRQLHDRCNSDNGCRSTVQKQIRQLQRRINLVIVMQVLGALSILFCTLSVFALFADVVYMGTGFFIISLLAMIASLILAVVEAAISGNALKIELSDMAGDEP